MRPPIMYKFTTKERTRTLWKTSHLGTNINSNRENSFVKNHTNAVNVIIHQSCLTQTDSDSILAIDYDNYLDTRNTDDIHLGTGYHCDVFYSNEMEDGTRKERDENER
jgi:hypothetical protein